MEGESPCISFDSSALARWADLTELPLLEDGEVEAMWSRAAPYLQSQADSLVNDYGWMRMDPTDGDLLHLRRDHMNNSRETNFHLPAAFSSFFNPDRQDEWKAMWEKFDARRLNGNNHTLNVNIDLPLVNIFCFVQLLAPGMLQIWPIDDDDDADEMTATRALPSQKWMSEHRDEMEQIIGTDRMARNIEAVNESLETKSGRWESYYDETPTWNQDYEDSLSWSSDSQGPGMDFTACDKECGYCGRCDY